MKQAADISITRKSILLTGFVNHIVNPSWTLLNAYATPLSFGHQVTLGN